MRLSTGSGTAACSRQLVPVARPSRNGKRSGSKSEPPRPAAERLVLDAAEDGAEGGEQPRPGIVPAFQHFLADAGRRLRQLRAEGRDGVVLVVERIAEQQQLPLLGQNRKTSRIMTVRAAS